MLLGVAELVAKVAYNATDPIEPFAPDTGWRIAPAAIRLAICVGDPELRIRIASAIDGWLIDPFRVKRQEPPR